MGLFDGFEAGWNSFVNNEWKSYTEFIKGGWEESTKPIWERDSTEKIFGEGAKDTAEDIFNPARWVDNAIDETVPEPLRDVTKKALPVAAIGGAALLALLILKMKF